MRQQADCKEPDETACVDAHIDLSFCSAHVLAGTFSHFVNRVVLEIR